MPDVPLPEPSPEPPPSPPLARYLTVSLRWLTLLEIVVRMFIWGAAFCLTVGIFNILGAWPRHGLLQVSAGEVAAWGRALVRFVLLYNAWYLLLLMLLRLPIPTPREGEYSLSSRLPAWPVLFSALLATLTKARYEAPFPAFLVHAFANLPPFCWLLSATAGPRSQSAFVTPPLLLDPHLITIGRNVTIGFNAIIAGHVADRERVLFKRVVIEDEAVVGAETVICPGCHIGRGAVIQTRSLLLPNTVVGPNEYWAGNPARRRREVPTLGDTL